MHITVHYKVSCTPLLATMNELNTSRILDMLFVQSDLNQIARTAYLRF